MTVDGKNEDLVNYWYRQDLSAGDTLLFTIEKRLGRHINAREYHLTRYYKQPVKMSIHLEQDDVCWQLVPRVLCVKDELPSKREDIIYDYRVAGYWRIAQTFQCRRKSNNDRGQKNGPLLEVTFAPVWVDYPSWKKKEERVKRKRDVHDHAPSTETSSSVGSTHPSEDYSLIDPSDPVIGGQLEVKPKKRRKKKDEDVP